MRSTVSGSAWSRRRRRLLGHAAGEVEHQPTHRVPAVLGQFEPDSSVGGLFDLAGGVPEVGDRPTPTDSRSRASTGGASDLVETGRGRDALGLRRDRPAQRGQVHL